MSVKISFVCPLCEGKNEGFLAAWEFGSPPAGEKALLLKINSCESGGIYGVYVECLCCGEDIDLMD